MKKSLIILMALVLLSVTPIVLAVNVGSGITPDIETEDFEPQVWMCDGRAVLDDETEPGRVPGNVYEIVAKICLEKFGPTEKLPACLRKLGLVGGIWDHIFHYSEEVSSYEVEGIYLWERFHNYAFEGEQIVWDVLVFDKNGIEKIEDVFATIGDVQGAGNDIEVNCILDEVLHDTDSWRLGGKYFAEHQAACDSGEYTGAICQRKPDLASCNARILEEELYHIEDNTMAKYTCILTVETPESMYGEYWVTVEAADLDGLSGTMDENEYWFFNPVIALSIDGDLTFENVRPGASAYSSTLLVGNDADAGSGVMLDMFISGTDFYDSSSSGAKCPLTNQLVLGNGDSVCDLGTSFGGTSGSNQGFGDPFCYFASNGAYSTRLDHRADKEGYVGIDYGIGFNDPNPFYGGYEIIHSLPNLGPANALLYQPGNLLSPGNEIAVTFRLNLPEPCNGDFDTGSLYFWGEAI